MKKQLLILITVFFTTISFSQEFEIIQGDIFKNKKKNSELVFSLNDEAGGLIIIRKYINPLKIVKGYYIQHFDKNLKIVDELDYKVKNNRIKNVFIKNKHLYIIEGQISSFKKIIEYNATIVDLNTFKFTTEEILNISKTNFNDYFKNTSLNSFFNNVNQADSNALEEQVILSDSNKYFSINIPIYNRENKKTKLFIYTNNLKLLYHRNINHQINEFLFDYLSIDISDEDGTLYLLGKSYENNSRKSKKQRSPNYHFELIKVNKNGQKDVSFKKEDKFIKSLSLVRKNHKISCVGFYGNKKDADYNGIAFIKLNSENLNIENTKYNPFTEQFLFDKYGENTFLKEKKNKTGISNIEFRSISALDNGDIIITAEEDIIVSNGSGIGASSTHFLNDIIALKLNSKGDFIWSRNIKKSQTGGINNSFTAFTNKNTTNIFINCSDKIKKLSGDRIQFGKTSAKKSNLYCIKIVNNGDISFEKLIDDKDSKTFYKVKNGIVSNNKDEVIFFGHKNSQLMKVKINN